MSNSIALKTAAPVLALLLFSGCSTPDYSSQILSGIPDYPQIGCELPTTASVAVYTTLWASKPLFKALKDAGFRVMDGSNLTAQTLEVPDFIIEPLSFRHTTESYHGECWLFTRVTVQVRKPARVTIDDTGVEWGEPRIFQAFARRNLGADVNWHQMQLHYSDNIDTAIANLLNVRPLREMLATAGGKK